MGDKPVEISTIRCVKIDTDQEEECVKTDTYDPKHEGFRQLDAIPTKPLKTPDGKFAKGNRGGGRPAVVRDVVLLARKHTVDAIETLAGIMRNKRMPAAARVRAAEVLIDRGYGKAPQIMNVVQHFASEELENLARRILRKRERRAAAEAATVVDAKDKLDAE